MGAIRLMELATSRPGELRIDRQAGVLRGVRVLGLTSKNGRKYLPEAARRALPLYRGAAVYLGHRLNAKVGRPPNEQFGFIENPRQAADGSILGDLHYYRAHRDAAQIVEMAERNPSAFGLSHDAVGRPRPGSGDTVIEDISQIVSVDIVGDPATNKSLWEQLDMNRQRQRRHREDMQPDDPAAAEAGFGDDMNGGAPGASGGTALDDAPGHGGDLMGQILALLDAAGDTDEGVHSKGYSRDVDAIRAICQKYSGGDAASDADASADPVAAEESRRRRVGAMRGGVVLTEFRNRTGGLGEQHRSPAADDAARRERVRRMRMGLI